MKICSGRWWHGLLGIRVCKVCGQILRQAVFSSFMREIARLSGAAKPQPVARSHRPTVNMPQPETLAFSALALSQLILGRVSSSASQQFWYAGVAKTERRPALAFGMAALRVLQLFGGRVLAPASTFLIYSLMAGSSARPSALTRKTPSSRIRFRRIRSTFPGLIKGDPT
jgi:hypothetical protein